VSSYLTTFAINNKQIICKELFLKDYKTILKCLVNDPIDVNELFLNLNEILTRITNLSKEEILSLNIFEYFYLLIKIRMISLGSSIFAIYNDEEKDISVDINLQKTLDELEKLLSHKIEHTYSDDNIQIVFRVPIITKILNSGDYIFVDKITTRDNLDFTVLDLPMYYIKVLNKYNRLINTDIKKYYFFKSSIKKYSVCFASDLPNYIQLIKILFNDNLLSVYENIYYLSKFCYLSPQYLEECTYGEFKIFVKKTEEILLKKASKIQTNVENDIDPVDINSLYGNEENLPITKSEFTP